MPQTKVMQKHHHVVSRTYGAAKEKKAAIDHIRKPHVSLFMFHAHRETKTEDCEQPSESLQRFLVRRDVSPLDRLNSCLPTVWRSY